MATILPFQPRDRHDGPSRANEAEGLTPDEAVMDRNSAQRRGEILLFTGVRYSRWADAGAPETDRANAE